MIEVETPSGATFTVLNTEEAEYFEDLCARYTDDNRFSNITDFQDLDRIIYMEMCVWRWSTWISQEQDYDGEPIASDEYSRQIKDYSQELRQLKKSLGMDKLTRESAKGESVPEYLENLRQRAKEFGYMRNQQADKAIELFQELSALVTVFDNCNEEERRDLGYESLDVINWILDVAMPEFQEIDENFRNTSQTYWIKQV